MANVITASENALFDSLLESIAGNLQLTPTLFSDAERKYRAVASWLGADGSLIASFNPVIYPQGSMSLQTTVKPRAQDEFDLDLVCLIHLAGRIDPDTLYRIVHNRLSAHEVYKKILEPRPRCLRLNYAGQFHLDIIPAIPDPSRGGTGILIPERDLGGWKQSDPKAYIGWFGSRCSITERIFAKAHVEPLQGETMGKKACLRLSTQLWKRHRDIVFEDRKKAPSSIVLTTLLGEAYQGHALCSDTLLAALDRITDRLHETTGILRVTNPVNSNENLTEQWDERFNRTFSEFVHNFRDRLSALVKLTGLARIERELSGLFGESFAKKAIEGFMDRVSEGRRDGMLHVSGSKATITTAMAGTRIASNTFDGN